MVVKVAVYVPIQAATWLSTRIKIRADLQLAMRVRRCDVVWCVCGVVWHCVVWGRGVVGCLKCDVVLCVTSWCGVECCVVWCGVAWYEDVVWGEVV